MHTERSNPLPTGLTSTDLTSGQRALLQHKIHIDPGAWGQSDAGVRKRLASAWTAALHLADSFGGLPDDALRWWAHHPRGHVLLTADEEGYCTGDRTVGDRRVSALALVPFHRIVAQPKMATIRALHVLDHLLGCNGEPSGGWLSDGGGCSLRWQRIGSRIAAIFPLGYGISPTAQQDPHWYLAEALCMALNDRLQLNVADPKLERLLHQSILDAGFWRNFLAEDQ